ncbi:cupin [Saccharothrix obliqua]|uniref:cupin n=1 Tax=Saccharothrix obliqua TaxID=2861747 RepID=UPI001C5F0418|nr:cupin [Saccharothrix obliqua]MBW4719071.1 cupin [Saccharothrix obliqua]
MRVASRFALTAAAVAGLLFALLPAAVATPGRGVTSVTVFDRVVGDTQYVLKEITIAPGGSTGWHFHPGPVHGLVKKGVLTHYDSTCAPDGVYRVGQVIAEPSGPGYVHIGQNLGSTPLVLEALYQNPVGRPLAVDVPNPGCSFE